jgi:uncharacterized protein
MGPTNVALVKLFRADQSLRDAQSRLDSVTKNVRIQERRIADLAEKLKLAQTKLREAQAQNGALDLDLKSRDAHIEKLRSQQQNAKNNKEYQTFLIEINTGKVDKAKIEEQVLKVMEQVETLQAEVKNLTAAHDGESAKLGTLKAEVGDKVAALQAEIAQLKPERDAAAAGIPAKSRDAFERMAVHHDGEAMAAIAKPNKREEIYLCTGCHMDLVTDVYNKLHSRDEIVVCPNCKRLLYIPDDLPPEVGVNKPKEKKEPKGKSIGAAIGRQSSAEDVLDSMKPDAEETEATADTDASSETSQSVESPASESQGTTQS